MPEPKKGKSVVELANRNWVRWTQSISGKTFLADIAAKSKKNKETANK